MAKRKVAFLMGLTGGGLAFGLAVRAPGSDQPPARFASAAVVPSSLSGCGPAALWAAVAAHDLAALPALRRVLEHDRAQMRPSVSLLSLRDWARACGVQAVGLKTEPDALANLSLPAVVHLRRGHFVTLLSVADDHVVIADQHDVPREVARGRFESEFSGYALCMTSGRARSRLGFEGGT